MRYILSDAEQSVVLICICQHFVTAVIKDFNLCGISNIKKNCRQIGLLCSVLYLVQTNNILSLKRPALVLDATFLEQGLKNKNLLFQTKIFILKKKVQFGWQMANFSCPKAVIFIILRLHQAHIYIIWTIQSSYTKLALRAS